MSGAWTQLEQLLTCAICLDRYRNPKLLPCHHTYCQEPCLEGLVDYARRQIKCPECRAEHRIPYQGVSTFPTNVTLVRFLELHRSITGEEPEPIPSMMERCAICSEKSSVERCAHCDKKICSECKEAHLDILKRELSRINAQVRRALTRLTDSVSATEKNCDKLLQNKLHIREEIEEIIRRFVKDLKDKESKLLHELEEYASNESNSLTKLKEDLNIEAVNISSNCDLIEKHVLEQNEPWTDAELVEYKDIFLKTLDFLRNFDPDTSDYTRRIRFIPSNDLDSLKKSLLSFGELKLPQPNSDIEFTGVLSPLNQTASTLNVPSLGASNALMRSQSDHRLAAQFARNERSNRYLEVSGSQLRLTDSGNVDRNDRAMSPLSFRRSNRSGQDGGSNDKYGSRYGEGKDEATRYRRTSDYTRDWPRPDDEPTSSARDGERFKSRFLRSDLDDDELSHTGSSGHRSVRFEEPDRPKETPKVFDTLDAPRGPLSGVPKITDTTHLMNRLHELQVKMKLEAEKKADEAKYTSSSTTTTTTTSSSVPRRSSQLATRQPSEDEIDRQKKANQAAAASASSTTTATAVATTTASATGTGDKDSSVASVTTSSSNSSGTTGNTSGSAPRSTGSSYLSRRVSSIRDEEEGNSTSSATSATSTSATRSGRTGDIGTPPTGRSAATSGRSNLASDANSASSVTASTTAVTGTGDDDEDIDSSSSSALARLARRRKSSIANSTTTVDSPSTAATSTSRQVSRTNVDVGKRKDSFFPLSLSHFLFSFFHSLYTRGLLDSSNPRTVGCSLSPSKTCFTLSLSLFYRPFLPGLRRTKNLHFVRSLSLVARTFLLLTHCPFSPCPLSFTLLLSPLPPRAQCSSSFTSCVHCVAVSVLLETHSTQHTTHTDRHKNGPPQRDHENIFHWRERKQQKDSSVVEVKPRAPHKSKSLSSSSSSFPSSLSLSPSLPPLLLLFLFLLTKLNEVKKEPPKCKPRLSKQANTL